MSTNHMFQPEKQGISVVEEGTMMALQELSDMRRPLLLPWCGGGATTTDSTSMVMTAVSAVSAAVIVVVLSMILVWWWRLAEAARVRKIVRRKDVPQVLPTPVAALPRWLGFFGGHTLLIKPQKVKNNKLLYINSIRSYSPCKTYNDF